MNTRRFYTDIRPKIEKDSDLADFFAYYLTIELGRPVASASEIRNCYEECDLHPPSWLASHFSKGLKSKPRRFIKRDSGYRLEEKFRDQIATRLRSARSETVPQGNEEPAGIEYLGIAGGSKDCQDAVEMLLQYGNRIQRAHIITCKNHHCLLLTDDIGDPIAIKSGFSSGYGGEGPRRFSYVIQLLDCHGAEIEELDVERAVVERLDNSALTQLDLKQLDQSNPIRPSRWHTYVYEADFLRGHDGTIWNELPPVIPFAIIDSRIMDLAVSFWKDPDDKLLKAYRRLEDLVRARTKIQEHGTKLFSQAFVGNNAKMTWQCVDDAEKIGRGTLFTAAYMAHRNPRAHRELKSYHDAQLSEFLLLNHLFRLEREAV